MSEEDQTLPGLQILDSWVRAQTQAWQKQVDTFNEVWGDVMEDAKPATFLQGYTKICNTYAENARLLWQWMGAPLSGSAAPLTDCPTVVFVLDHVAESSDRRTVPLPFNVAPGDIAPAPLKRIDGADEANVANKLDIAPHSDGRSIVLGVKAIPSPRPTGTYIAFIHSKKLPPPLVPIAVVLVRFLAAPPVPAPTPNP